MSKTFRRLVTALAALAIVYLLVVLAAAVLDVADFAARFDPRAGQWVLWGLGTLTLAAVVSPLIFYLRLPPALVPPAETEGPEHEAYLAALRKRLRKNPRLAGMDLDAPGGLEAALSKLAAEADRAIEEGATTVFLGTAMLQNGRLDGLVVLASQARMVYRVARIYFTRPSLRQLLYLYANVGTSAFLAAQIEDIDFSEMVKPFVFSVAPALKGGVPGMAGVSTLLVNSLSSGAANAFLTLRVGAVTRQYCEATSTPDRSVVRRSALASAASHLGRIVRINAQLVVQSVWSSVKGSVGSSMSKAVEGTRAAAGSMAGRIFRRGGRGDASG